MRKHQLPLAHSKTIRQDSTQKKTWRFWRSFDGCGEPGRNAFYQEFKFFWVCFKLLGMLPYHIDSKGNVRLALLSKEMVYSAVVYFTLSIPIWLTIGFRCRQKMLAQDNFDHMLFSFLMACTIFPHFSVPLAHWRKYKKHESIFKTWHEFQKKYESTFGIELRLRNKCKLHFWIMCLVSKICVVFSAYFLIIKFQYWWELVAHLYAIWIYVLHLLIYVEQCLCLITIARDLKLKTIEAINMRSAGMVAEYNVIWIHLSELGGLVGCLFCRMLSCLLLTIFAVSTIAMYMFLKVKHYRTSLLFPIISIITCKLWIYSFCECGERIATELGHKYTMQLCKIRPTIKDEDTKIAVDNFIGSIKNIPPAVTLYNFTTVNRRLLVTIYSTMVTYLIVVVQFSQDYHLPVSPSAWEEILANTTAIFLQP